jgi:DNA polymerase-3 subunit chi
MACEVWFYHLESSGLEQVLPELLSKTMGRGWTALVRAASRERLDHLDGWLWSYRDDAFLAHGLDDEPMADRQPILLTTRAENANGANALFLLDGAEPGELDSYERCIILFDGRDQTALEAARAKWAALKAQKLAISYWRQNPNGGWDKQA